jgi:hypothetical protein
MPRKYSGVVEHSGTALLSNYHSAEDDEATMRDVVNDDLLARRTLILDTIHTRGWDARSVSIAEMASALGCNQNLIAQTVRRYPMYFVLDKPNSTYTRKHRSFKLHPHLQPRH